MERAAKQVDIETLLAKSDVISLNAPLNSTSEKMMDAAALSKVKRVCLLSIPDGGSLSMMRRLPQR